ncbi:hypothetical protein CDAR_304051, partial [Caerostris darwini]
MVYDKISYIVKSVPSVLFASVWPEVQGSKGRPSPVLVGELVMRGGGQQFVAPSTPFEFIH